jgi:F0F1-type ATP synthase membrane subunit b/b'
MKQAKADAQELIDAYRAEKQQEFNNTVLAAGKCQ